MQPFLKTALGAVTVNCLAGLCRVWRGLLPGGKRDKREIAIADSELHVQGSPERLPLNEDERALLSFFLENRGAVFTPETLLSRLWWPDLKHDRDFVDGTVAALNILLHKAGLGQEMIESFHGVGYRLKPADEAG